jgi:SAM-dependent methyltransferase
MQRFDASLVEVVYGVEPSPHYAANLGAKISQFGLEGKYTLLNCGIEEGAVLERSGIVEGSMDTVLSIQVLCSVKDVKGVVRECWKLLKPGGNFVFWEHVRSKDNVTGVVQGTSFCSLQGIYACVQVG